MSQKPPIGHQQEPQPAPPAPKPPPHLSPPDAAAWGFGANDRRAGWVPAYINKAYIDGYCAEAERQTRAECEAEALPPNLRPLFDYFYQTHGLAMTSSELYDIQSAATAYVATAA